MENIQESFFSKNNVNLLFNKLVETLKISNNDRQTVGNMLLKNMNIVWKNLDISKINNNNIQFIFQQFNSIVLKNTSNEISKNKNIIKDPSELKFQRDFNSTPNNGVTYSNRPQAIIKSNNNIQSKLGPNEPFIKQAKERQQHANTFDSSLDKLFRPIINETSEEPNFNNYNSKSSNYQEKLQEIQQLRNTEVPTTNKKNDLPDFLKPKSTNVREKEILNNNQNNYQNNNQNNYQNNYQNNNRNNNQNNNQNNNRNNNQNNNRNTEQMNFLDGVDNDDNLFSLDNIDKPIIDENINIQEDMASFEERLKKLKSQRDSIQMPSQQNIDFQSEDYRDTYEELKNYKPTEIITLQNKQNNNEQNNNELEYLEFIKYKKQRENELLKQRENELLKQRENELLKQRENELLKQRENELLKQKENELLKQKKTELGQKEINNYKKYIKEKNEVEKNKIPTTHKELFDQLKNLNKNLMNQISGLKEDNIKLKEDNIKLKENNFKLEEDNIKLKEDNFTLKEDNFILKEDNIKLKEANFKLKDHNFKLDDNMIDNNEVLKLKNEIKNLKILNKQYKKYQLEISPDNSFSNYTFNLSESINIMGIKLLDCMIPFKKYNIEENINNLIKYKIDNENKEIIIKTGLYNIDQLLNSINELQNDLIFELDNLSQKVKIKSEKEFELNYSELINSNLGFIEFDNQINFCQATNMYDLRIDNKIYLFITNINEAPFCIITPNNTNYDSEIFFDNPITINSLDISFKDSKNNDINFYDIKHYLNFQFFV